MRFHTLDCSLFANNSVANISCIWKWLFVCTFKYTITPFYFCFDGLTEWLNGYLFWSQHCWVFGWLFLFLVLKLCIFCFVLFWKIPLSVFNPWQLYDVPGDTFVMLLYYILYPGVYKFYTYTCTHSVYSEEIWRMLKLFGVGRESERATSCHGLSVVYHAFFILLLLLLLSVLWLLSIWASSEA